MKKILFGIFLTLSATVMVAAPPVSVASATLKERGGWVTDSIAPGYTWYNYTGYYAPTRCNQTVNVLEIIPDYPLRIVHSSTTDSLSAFAMREGAIGGINGSYFDPDASFVKTNNVIHRQASIASDHVMFWKHEGALFYNPQNHDLQIAYGTNAEYAKSEYPVVLSGAPMLIDNYNPVGISFVGNIDSIDLKTLDYEDYRRHQGVRHPRVAVAKMEDGRILLIAVDGRQPASGGMSATELTKFIVRYFAPQYALNLDGGGSTTIWIKARGTGNSNVVNFPTDNKRYDHFGQRKVENVILIMPATNKNRSN